MLPLHLVVFFVFFKAFLLGSTTDERLDGRGSHPRSSSPVPRSRWPRASSRRDLALPPAPDRDLDGWVTGGVRPGFAACDWGDRDYSSVGGMESTFSNYFLKSNHATHGKGIPKQKKKLTRQSVIETAV